MSSSEPQADLHQAFVVLNERWEAARSLWRDSVALEFERRFWSEITQNLRRLERSAEGLSVTMVQALRQTES